MQKTSSSFQYLSEADLQRIRTHASTRCCEVGDLVFDEQGLAKRGVLVRHLVMPGNEEDSRKVMRYLAHEVSPHTYVNIMDQYRPAWKVTENRYREINRRTTAEEHLGTIRIAREEGLYRFDARDSVTPPATTSR